MTEVASRLFLRRFLVFANGAQIYSQEFHSGLNVIRGDHAVGKSTLLDLVFYCLGGELRREQWVYPADNCSTVCAEVEINGRPICFKRDIEVGGIPKIDVFDGTFAQAMQSIVGWQSFGPRRNDRRSSFSQFLFELFGWGVHKTDDYANLTMHQILRLLYVDQETPSNKIFRAEPQNADSESVRQAIADFLLNLDDLELHAARQDLLAANRAFDKAETELNAIFSVLGKDSNYNAEKLRQEISNIFHDIQRLDHERKNATEAAIASGALEEENEEQRKKYSELSREIEILASIISESDVRLSGILGEIADCRSFRESIKNRKKSLLESQAAYETIGGVTFKRCPCCNSTIAEVSSDTNTCPLCKSSSLESAESNPYLEILTELDFQEKQNTTLIAELDFFLNKERSEKQVKTQELNAKKAILRTMAAALSKREQFLVDISRQIGFAESQVASLNEKIEIIERVDGLRQLKSELNNEIGRLKDLISQLAASGASRRDQVMSSIGYAALQILELDEKYEQVFSDATSTEAEIDFAKDRWLVDGRSKFSASSNVFKKNALHAAILAYAISDKKCRHPRFLILDDVENGGTTEPRSQNFQRILASLIEGREDECQVIISTAMVDPSLDNERFGVGPSYKKGEYVLQLH